MDVVFTKSGMRRYHIHVERDGVKRYHRLDHDHLEMILNITDPKTYVGTWKGDRKAFNW